MHSAPTQLSHPAYRPDIDGLRAVAVLSVVAFHAFPTWIRGGFIGVDIFFVISGFLISTIIFENLGRGTFSFSEFYARRVARIFPALFIVMLGTYLFGWFALLADEYKQLGRHIAAGAGFFSNFVLAREAGYFDTAAETKPLLHLWSLAVEEQFYLIWPLLLWLTWKARVNLVAMTLVIATVSFYLNIQGIEENAATTFFAPHTRFWELLCGALLAWTALHVGQLRATTSELLGKSPLQSTPARNGARALASNMASCLGLLLLAYALWRIDKDHRFPGVWAAIPVAGAMLCIVAGPQAWTNRYLLSNRVLVWFGLISYPLYLWHWPMLSLARIIDSEPPSLWVRITIIASSILLAWLTYKVVERPVRTRSGSKRIVWMLISLVLLLGGLGQFTRDHRGLPSRASLDEVRREQDAMTGFGEDDPSAHAACLELYQLSAPIRYCNVSGPGKPRIALIGDSHARALYGGLKEELHSRGEGLVNIGGRLFVDLAVYARGDLADIEAYQGGIRATQFAAAEPSIDTVIMASLGPLMLGLGESHVFQLISEPAIKDRRIIWERAMRKTLDLFMSHNKSVIFVIDNPHIDFDPRSCLKGRPIRLHSKPRVPCAIPRSQFDREAQAYRDVVLSVLHDYPKVKVFDSAAYLCDERWCWASKDGLPLYEDSNHLGLAGSRLIAKELVKVLEGEGSTRLAQ
jgi:peptidoglycan/LPS O-acetylase OafA/YrhL